jgi:hypothetical protein
MRCPECVGCARFHLDENQCFFAAITANQIDFAAPSRSEIFVEDTKSVVAKVLGSHFFALLAERQMRRDNSLA